MEYRFSLTPRMIGLALFAVIALLMLLFTLGFQIGQRMAKPDVPAAEVGALGAQVRGQLTGTTQQAGARATEYFNGAAKPLVEPGQAAGKVTP